ncbi:hypothetical protein [Roseicyclus persicicus]|uniref:Uncharacterized protein n=1 Tax=Roseicyclus persicicus TaxID=2650661 RepID=A0A7X6GZG9_9RHOB|nr:hypothetical protein [Roseibacterium persicicum]NKX45198.1 hypothetical protein [Roseibacterium persicicum]
MASDVVSESNRELRFDFPWPFWAYGKYELTFAFNEAAHAVGQQPHYFDVHPLFKERPRFIVLSSTEKRSVVVLGDGDQALGEAWLRIGLFVKGGGSLFSWICETYRYRRAWRDELTTEMDGERAGPFVLPSREKDLICRFRRHDQALMLVSGTFFARLSRCS